MDIVIDTENQHAAVDYVPSPARISSATNTPQPLRPISSERQNQQRLPQSPSLPTLDGNGSSRKAHHSRLSDASDVKARVAFLNAISQPGSPTRTNSPPKASIPVAHHAAMQRAILGREEAETALGAMSAQLESSKARERLVSERVESLMEQLNEARSRQRHERTVYEKEIKQTKKAEYKAEMAVIKLQEDLREARSELESYKAKSDHNKTEKEKARQEAFERAYVVAGMTEEVQDLKQRLEVAEQQRDAAVAMAASKMPVQENEVVSLETTNAQEAGSKRKQPMSDINLALYDDFDLAQPDCPIEIKYAALQREVSLLQRKIQEDQETIHFMNMQCQFKACPCRMAEHNGVRFVHDYEYDAKVRAQNAKKRKIENLEPQKPLPTFKSWRQKQDELKGKQVVMSTEGGHAAPPQRSIHQLNARINEKTEDVVSQEQTPVVEAPDAPLPPAEVVNKVIQSTEESAVLEQAVNVPLPASRTTKSDPSDETPEPTAQLEDLTQLIVEAGGSSKNFLFSKSTDNRLVHDGAHGVNQSDCIRMSDDLFDISPPKKNMPPRPSTAMGVLTTESPIRLVPNSPHTFQRRAMTPEIILPHPKTTRVALNDTSPVRQARQQRHRQPPSTAERTRGRSPAPTQVPELDRSSPAPSTVFPITPGTKHERVRPQVHIPPRPQTTQDFYASNRNEISTTTTVPLRDDAARELQSSTEEYQVGPSSSTAPFSVPGTPNMTREQALAQIRARRDRARSVNMRKSADEGSKTPGSVARRGVNLKDRLGDVRGRDFSQASAPGRI